MLVFCVPKSLQHLHVYLHICPLMPFRVAALLDTVLMSLRGTLKQLEEDM